MKTCLAFFFLFTLCTLAVGQTFPTSTLPIGIMPIQYNSSFAGSAGNSRISSSISLERMDDGTSQNNYFHAFASYDAFLPKLRSGIGVNLSSYRLSSDNNSESYWSNHFSATGTEISFTVAPKISINGKYTFSPSLEIGLFANHLDFLGNSQNWTPDPNKDKGDKYGLTSRLGFLLNTERYYIGYSVSLFRIEFSEDYKNYFYSNLQVGYTFQRNDQSKFSFTPQFRVVIRDKDEFHAYNISKPFYNLGIRYGQVLASIISNNDFKPNGFQLGWQNNGWRILTSHEFDFRYYKIYSPSLSLRYIFNHEKKSVHIYDQSF